MFYTNDGLFIKQVLLLKRSCNYIQQKIYEIGDLGGHRTDRFARGNFGAKSSGGSIEYIFQRTAGTDTSAHRTIPRRFNRADTDGIHLSIGGCSSPSLDEEE